MKTTKNIRRIDDLGRIVIPRNIREKLGIKEGDPFEIAISEEGCIVLKKYNPNTNKNKARKGENNGGKK